MKEDRKSLKRDIMPKFRTQIPTKLEPTPIHNLAIG